MMRETLDGVDAASTWTMRLPVPVEFGAGCIERLPEYLPGRRKVLVVSQLMGTPAEPIIARIREVLERSGAKTEAFHEFSAEFNHDEIEAGASIAREFGAEAVVGYGGGSSMDAAKLIALGAGHAGPLLSYRVGGTREITSAVLPIIAVPSTSGTGSHIGRVAVVSEREKQIKRFMASDHLYPKAAFCDPAILREMPPEVTAASGFDAFAQALEGYLSKAENPMGNLCALEAMRIISATLPAVIANGSDMNLRTSMAWADTLQGVTLATNAVLTAHVIGMVLGGRYHIPHGRAVAAVTVAALRHSRPGADAKIARIGRVIGCPAELPDKEAADSAVARIEALIREAGLEKRLSAYGVPNSEHRAIAEEVNANFRMRLDNDPEPTGVEELVRILRESA